MDTFSNIVRVPHRENKFEIHQLNCNGLLSANRIAELKLYIYGKKPDVVCLCETFIKSKQREPKFIGYHEPVSKYRTRAAKGGLSIVIREDIEYRVLNLLPYNGGELEYQAVSVNSELGPVDIINIYNPHHAITKEEYIHYILQVSPKFVLLGDFNSHSTLWNRDCRTNAAGRELEKLLNDVRVDVGLLNDDYTKTYLDLRTGTSSCLDLCFASTDLILQGEIERENDMGSDHYPMRSSFGFKLLKTPMTIKKKWKYKEANWRVYEEKLQAENSDVWPTDACSGNKIITKKISMAAKEAVPQTKGKRSYNLTVHGMNAECARSINVRSNAKGKLFRSPTPENLEVVKATMNQAKWKIKKARKKSFADFVGTIDFETSNGEAWQKVKCLKNGKIFSPTYPVGPAGTALTDRANLFVEQFAKKNNIIANTDANVNKEVDTYLKNQQINQKPLTMHELKEALKKLKNTAPGPDDVL
jgi:hypothetical protein